MVNVNCSITIAWAYTYCTYIMTHHFYGSSLYQ